MATQFCRHQRKLPWCETRGGHWNTGDEQHARSFSGRRSVEEMPELATKLAVWRALMAADKESIVGHRHPHRALLSPCSLCANCTRPLIVAPPHLYRSSLAGTTTPFAAAADARLLGDPHWKTNSKKGFFAKSWTVSNFTFSVLLIEEFWQKTGIHRLNMNIFEPIIVALIIVRKIASRCRIDNVQ